MTDIGSNVFEEFYSTLKKTLITEAKNSSVKNLTPSERNYPVYARDKSDYKYQVVYVSKGTWKLNNLHKGSDGEIDFTWN